MSVFVLVACFVMIVTPLNVHADTSIVSNITADTTWNIAGSPFIVSRSVAIDAGVTLTIDPGVVVKFSQQAAALVVNGTLEATGTGDSLIYFTSFKDDAAGGDTNGDGAASAPAAGDWREIQVNPGGAANLVYAVITYGGANVCCLQSNADVYNHGGTLSIASSTIAYATTFGIRSGPGTTTIIASTIAHTPVGIPVGGSGITVRDSLFTGNTSYPMVINNIIDFTHSGNRAVGNAHDGFLLGTDFVADETLPPEGASYIINGVTIPAGKTLTFESGAVVKFLSPASYLLVNGTLNVAGTSAAPVVLTSYADDTGWDTNGDGSASAPAPGNWKHVQVGPGGTADIAYARIRYGGADVCCLPSLADVGNRGGVLAITDSVITNGATYGVVTSSFGTTTVSRSEIAYNRQGFALGSGSASLAASSVHDNSLYGASNASATSSLSIAGNYWGDPTGPSYWLNPGGLGNKVGSRVDPYPWLQSDPATEPPTEPACTENCNDNVLFLPGIEASRLYEPQVVGNPEKKLWEPSGDADAVDLALDGTGTSVRNDIYAKGLVDEAYGTLNVYKSFLDDLAAWKGSGLFADYAAVPYDWRLSLSDVLSYGHDVDGKLYYSGTLRATSTPYIIQELRRLADSSRSGKVTIIAHSNGGLVAKALIKQLQDVHDPLAERIDKLILVAVPQTGTPTAIGALLHGFGQGIPTDWSSFLLSPAAARTFAGNAPMAYHLLPSAAYFSGPGSETQTPVITFVPGTSTARFIAAYGTSISTPSSLAAFLAGADGRGQPDAQDLVDPAKVQPGLQSYAATAHAALDSWTPPASMQVYQIAGWGEDTVSGITYANDRKCIERHFLRCTRYEDVLRYTPNTVVDGDGTVAASSALAMSTSSANVSRWWVNLHRYNAENILESGILGRQHAGILEVPELRFLINAIERGVPAPGFSYISTAAPSSGEENRLKFTLHSPLSLSVRDNLGNEISRTSNNIPGARYRRFGEVQYISVPADAHATLHLSGEESGSFTLEALEMHDGIVVASTTFEGIPVATTSTASMSFEDGTLASASPLAVDVDGDGASDVSLPVSVGQTVDYVPPKLPLSVTADSKTIVLGASAQTLSATITGFADGDTATSSTTGVPSCGTAAVIGVGSYDIVCSLGTLASDTYSFGTFATGTLSVIYGWNGFSQPINDPERKPGQKPSVFKAGSTVPVKFQLTDAKGRAVQAKTLPRWLVPEQGDLLDAKRNEEKRHRKASTSDVYKWDSKARQYVYNWDTKGIEKGHWYQISVQLDDGQTYSVVVGLK